MPEGGGQFHKTLQWLRCRREAERLAEADAEALIRDHGAEAYGKALARACRGPARRDNPCRPDAGVLTARRGRSKRSKAGANETQLRPY